MEKKRSAQPRAALPHERTAASHVSQKQPAVAQVASLAALAERLADVSISESEGQSSVLASECFASVFAVRSKGGGKMLGVLARCMIPGCDVHFVDDCLEPLAHVGEKDSLPNAFAKARAHLKSTDETTIAVLVFEDEIQALSLDGSRRRVG